MSQKDQTGPVPNQQAAQAKKGKAGKLGEREMIQKEIPLFYGECLYKEVQIPASHYYTDIIDIFELPPLGKSTQEDFNPMAHIELEQEEVSQHDDSSSSEQFKYMEESVDSMQDKVKVQKVKNLNKIWLNIQPDQ